MVPNGTSSGHLSTKMAAHFFIFPRHSETLFEVKNSEFRCEMKFRKSLHFYSEKLRISEYILSKLM